MVQVFTRVLTLFTWALWTLNPLRDLSEQPAVLSDSVLLKTSCVLQGPCLLILLIDI